MNVLLYNFFLCLNRCVVLCLGHMWNMSQSFLRDSSIKSISKCIENMQLIYGRKRKAVKYFENYNVGTVLFSPCIFNVYNKMKIYKGTLNYDLNCHRFYLKLHGNLLLSIFLFLKNIDIYFHFKLFYRKNWWVIIILLHNLKKDTSHIN